MSEDIRPLHVGKFVPPPYAGVEAHVDTLLRALLPQIRGTLVAGESETANLDAVQHPYRVLTARSFGKFASATMSPCVLSLVRKELSSQRCNLLHIHAPNPWGDTAILTGAGNAPVVMTWHSDIVRQKQLLKFYRPIQLQALKRADRIVVFTPKHYESSEQLHQIDLASKIVHVPIGIDFSLLEKGNASLTTLKRLDEFASGRPLLLTVGRHVYYKGYEHLLSAMATLQTDTVLVMVGAGPLTDVLKRQAVESGIDHRVLFLGEVDHPTLVAAFHRCDVFCLPSIAPSEAFGIASAEAMACGKPTVVCELNNGVNYLNQAGTTGLTVAPCDVPALADAIDTLMLNDNLRLSLGRAANDWVRAQFSIQAMRDGTVQMYCQLL